MAELGERAGVSGPAIHRHFSSKDEVLAIRFDRALDRLMVHTPPPRDDPHETLQELVAAQVQFALEAPAVLAVCIRADGSLADDRRAEGHSA